MLCPGPILVNGVAQAPEAKVRAPTPACYVPMQLRGGERERGPMAMGIAPFGFATVAARGAGWAWIVPPALDTRNARIGRAMFQCMASAARAASAISSWPTVVG